MTTFVLSLIKGGVNKGLNLFVGVIFVFIIVFQINQGVSKAMKKNRIHTAKMGDSVRKSYATIKEVLEMPNLIEVQKDSYKDEKRKLAETFVADSESLPILSNEQWVDLL